MHEILKLVHGITRKVPEMPHSADDPSGIGGLIQNFPHGFVPADR